MLFKHKQDLFFLVPTVRGSEGLEFGDFTGQIPDYGREMQVVFHDHIAEEGYSLAFHEIT